MSLVINTNADAITARNNLENTQTMLSSAMQRLSSGLRINTAADDAAGYAIVQPLTGQVNGLDQATQNAQDAVSLVQTADGTLNDVRADASAHPRAGSPVRNGTHSAQDHTRSSRKSAS